MPVYINIFFKSKNEYMLLQYRCPKVDIGNLHIRIIIKRVFMIPIYCQLLPSHAGSNGYFQ